ncbi:MAG: glutamate--tRNA ligase [Candidatus Woesearchaeota archaeon]
MDDLIYKHALYNAVKHDGKANQGAVISNIIGEKPDLKNDIKDLAKKVSDIIKKINSMSIDQQKKELEKYPDKEKKNMGKERDIFEFLKIKQGSKIRTAFPPGPEKYPHIGHAKALILNYELAKKYNGEFYLRFEDTNPTLVKKEFYEIMQENFKWLGVKWDKLDYASDHMDKFYYYAKKLLKENKAYVCDCDKEKIKVSRAKGIVCAHRSYSEEENLKLFDEMIAGKHKNSIVRLKIDLRHQNTTMRDPAILRNIEEPHARQGKKYHVWPIYDFQNAIMDGVEGITHRLRSKEFEMRNELHRYIQNILELPETNIYEFARFNMVGVESSGRIIREKIQKKELFGWDDPSLTTLVALRRRGFLPQAIKDFVFSTGITKHESTMTWDDLIVHNKRLLDKQCRRYFFIENPKEIIIKNAPEQKLKLKSHPDNPELGFRNFETHKKFLITKTDFDSLSSEKLYRLMDCLNFRTDKVDNKSLIFDSLEYEEYKDKGEKIMHWLPLSKDLVDVEIIMPDHEIKKGKAEYGVKNLKEGDVVQFERFGFCRLDNKKNMVFWFTHK